MWAAGWAKVLAEGESEGRCCGLSAAVVWRLPGASSYGPGRTTYGARVAETIYVVGI
jgi:hypothetical protein